MTAAARLASAVALTLIFSAPGGAQSEPGAGAGGEERLRILAAASLTEVAPELARAFAAIDGGEEAQIEVGASSRLARQLLEGAPADLIITADNAWMDVLAAEGAIDAASRFALASGELVLVEPVHAALRLIGPEALLSPAVKRIAVAGENVPAGRRAREALATHGLLGGLTDKLHNVASVRSALALAAAGEVDAAIVYNTDARVETRVRVAYRFANSTHGAIVYPIALTARGSANPRARAFLEFLRSAAARAILDDAGFLSPIAVEDSQVARPGEGKSAPLPASGAGDAGADEAAGDARGARAAGDSRGATADWSDPLLVSLIVAAISLLISIVPAIYFGWVLARRDFTGKTLLSTFLLLPLVMPPVVTGYLLLMLFGKNGVLNAPLAGIGLEVAFTQWGAIVAAAVVGFPLLVTSARLAIEAVDRRYERLAETLGSHPFGAFMRVTLPLAAPGILAGSVLAFARGLGEFGATIVLAGDTPGETRTLALAVYSLYEQPGGQHAAQILILVSVCLSLAALFGYERLVRAQRRRAEELAR